MNPVREIPFSDVQFLVLFFQRDYAWTQVNWERLRKDIWQLLDDGPDRKHFLGPLVVCSPLHLSPGDSAQFQLIDGQQRLTTLSLLLLALRDVAIEKQQDELAAEINESYLVHRFKKELNRYKLVPRSGDRVKSKKGTQRTQLNSRRVSTFIACLRAEQAATVRHPTHR